VKDENKDKYEKLVDENRDPDNTERMIELQNLNTENKGSESNDVQNQFNDDMKAFIITQMEFYSAMCQNRNYIWKNE